MRGKATQRQQVAGQRLGRLTGKGRVFGKGGLHQAIDRLVMQLRHHPRGHG